MRIAHKILLAALMALAAMAFAASTASAQETPVEFENENNAPCNPCVVHVEGESHIRALNVVGQPLVSECHDEFAARLRHFSGGEIEWVGVDHPGPSCTVSNCAPPENHWPVSNVREHVDGSVEMTVRFCLSGLHCNGNVRVTELPSHNYHFAMTQLCAGGAREVEGEWRTEAEPNFEIDHTPGT
jgi:hypothetical protein